MNATKILWSQVLTVSLVALAFVWGTTEWVAWRLVFQPQLGRPWFELFGRHPRETGSRHRGWT